MNPQLPSDTTLIIDAGHGGEDGGAVAVSGTAESHINLAIALKTDQLCGLFGIRTILTRTEDISLADESATTIRMKKRSDLMNRAALVNDTPNAILLSIHQNNFSSSRSRGAQVFFHDDLSSQNWAQHTQTLFQTYLDPNNQRKATKIPDSVYLMNHISCRSVLVECGFLSNPEEDALLESDGYQTKLAVLLTTSFLTFDDTLPQGAL